MNRYGGKVRWAPGRPSKNKRHMNAREWFMGFVAFLLVLTIMAGGVLALLISGVFTPRPVVEGLQQEPGDYELFERERVSWWMRWVSVAHAESGTKSGVNEEQRQQLIDEVRRSNEDAYTQLRDPWDIDDIMSRIQDEPVFFVPDTARVTIRKNDLNLNTTLPSEWVNILLLGTDDRGEEIHDGRTDAMLIVSLNSVTGEIKLISLARDLYVDIPNLPNKDRLNVAHAYGGPNLAMKAVNTLFDLNITEYFRVNLHGVVEVIDRGFGTVYIDLQPGEAAEINYNVAVSEDYEGFPRDESRKPLSKDQVGITRLDALQALSYARIRHIDSDFGRTNRQRILLDTMLEMAKADASPQKVVLLANIILPYMTTNIPFTEIVRLGAQMVTAGVQPMDSFSLPIDGSFTFAQADQGESILETNIKTNRDALHQFIYGQVYPKN